VVLVFSSLCTSARSADVDALIRSLSGDDERARSEARQLLPRAGVSAVPRILPLLANDRPAVWTAAFNTLADFANDVSVPGREADRAAMTASLMTLVAPDQPRELKIRGLRLLAIVVPPQGDVGPVAALLADPDLREKAREALEEIGTPPARAALREAAEHADSAFAAAILNSLGRLRDPASVDLARRMARSGDPAVRASALRCLSWTGDADVLGLGRQVVESADATTHSDAVDAFLRLVGAVARADHNRAVALATYLDLLKKGHGAEKDAALAGLARVGDASCVEPILEVVRLGEPPTSLVAIDALRSLSGGEVTRALVKAYPDQPASAQAELVSVLGARRDPVALPILETELGSSQPAVRRAAMQALGETGLSGALDVLMGAAKVGSGDDRRAVRESLLRLAQRLQAAGDLGHAGRAYAGALEDSMPSEGELRLSALEGLAACPMAAASAAIESASADPALREPAIRALLATARVLAEERQNEPARALYRRVRELNPPAEAVRDLVRGITALGDTADLQGLLGTINHWWVVGPFELGEHNEGWDTEFVGEPNVNVVGRYMSGKSRVGWKSVATDDPTGKIDMRSNVANRDHCIGYAYTELVVDEPVDAVLLLGVDDSEKAWVNGEKVFELFTARGLQVDQDRIPVHLHAGKNTILLKIYQQTLGWEFCARLVMPDGRPLAFTQKME
jgi:HEAT repeat protein